MEEGEGGMIWENSIEAYTLPYLKQMTSMSSVNEAEHPKLVLWDNLEGGVGREAGGEFMIGGTHVYLWLIHIDVWQKPSKQCKVIIIQLK